MDSEKKHGESKMAENEQEQHSMIDATAEAVEMEPATDNILQTAQQGSTSPRKKLKITESHEDRISNLPDCIISHILSRLDTVDAVATSILSRNWRYKYTKIYNINLSTLYLHAVAEEERDGSFHSLRSFLNRIVVLNDPWKIQSFSFVCIRISSEDIQEWTTAVLRRNVENLQIWAPLTDCSASPQCFSGWSSLTELNLSLQCILGVTTMNCFPNLKSLSLRNGVQVKNEESRLTSRVILTFPVLEVLELKSCKWVNVDTVEIEAPKLIRFTSESYEEEIPNFLINAPSVTYACLDLDNHDDFALWVLTVLKGFQNLRCLKLPGGCLEGFITAKQMFGFPLHGRLVELRINGGRVHTAVLMEFLNAFPSLQSINLYGMIALAPPGNDVQVVEPIPLCIRSHLKKFRYYMLGGQMSVDDLALVGSVLKNAKNLQKVIVVQNDEEHAAIMLRHFSKLIPEGSSYALSTEEYDGSMDEYGCSFEY